MLLLCCCCCCVVVPRLKLVFLSCCNRATDDETSLQYNGYYKLAEQHLKPPHNLHTPSFYCICFEKVFVCNCLLVFVSLCSSPGLFLF